MSVQVDILTTLQVRLRRDCITCAAAKPQGCRCSGPNSGHGVCTAWEGRPDVEQWLDTYRPQVSWCSDGTGAPHEPITADAPDCPGWR